VNLKDKSTNWLETRDLQLLFFMQSLSTSNLSITDRRDFANAYLKESQEIVQELFRRLT
jgi:hypothetical protein